ncbi:MAG TPA: glycosyltransferase family 4 protein [Puia sp.]|jgi:glycosyltransferase involved in cell wall biosynthesis|nr:glycosyltransferase family 4 protein [Puia sp.]
MKVLLIARASLYRNRGGDTIQILKTAEYLRKLGVEADVRLTDEPIDYSGYQLLHFFNIIRPADILKHITASGKPYVVSPVFVDYSESDAQTRKGPLKLLFTCFSEDRIEYFKVLARWLFNGERIMSPSYLFYGQRGSVRRIIRGAVLLLPNSDNEYRRLFRRYRTGSSYRVIPNGIDPVLFSPPEHPSVPVRENDLVLCAGRIEGIKNQLNLIRAVNGSSFRLLLVGAPAVNQRAYYEKCRREAGPAISFVGAVPQEELLDYYNRARVHVLPSWFETTGLSSLEAAAMGCSIVITDRGDTSEYFGDQAIYCDPASPASILEALKRAAGTGPSEELRKKILSHYTWRQTADKTFEAYKEMLDAR